ncbi:LacI family transcriptional regulator (plasmid) [Pedobacter sp. BS3]|uniref:LacI family DNA-binding transcriptional regulator n=1 Tax=Pedobacter sp. BS3 TaxID=2567937 RepID=UPI0011F09567|nr:LacI family DNA-binding transcriptional regulator [Pedobacter sp. BS3]TZF85799.1 LacI family transcriptional regulator [Pedobacter sp. BS3]
MSKKTTIQDIAQALNTTVSTVSRALSGHPGISDAMKKNVRRVAKELNYSQNKIASSLRSGRTHIIGVIVPDAQLSFFASVIHGIEKVMNKNGYTVLLYQSGESYAHEVKGVKTLLQSRVDGIIASASFETEDYTHFQDAIDQGTPLVFFDRVTDKVNVPSVFIDDHKGGFMATEHLIQQGYKRIAYIAARQNVGIFKKRLNGHYEALRQYGLPVSEELVVFGDVSIESGRRCIKQLLALPKPPDAIVAVEDFTALGAIQELKARNINIPEEVGVIGFANEAFSAYITPSLSTIDQQTIAMGEEAAKILLEWRQKTSGTKAMKKVILDPVLIARQSSMRNVS